MTQCPVHGLSFGITVCVHLDDAVYAGVAERARVILDDWAAPSLVCEPCHRKVMAAGRSSEEPQVGFDHILDPPPVPCCVEHVREWYAATGQGDLSEAIKSAA